jgi:protein TonB
LPTPPLPAVLPQTPPPPPQPVQVPPPAPAPPPVAPAPAPAPASSANAEASYTGKLRAYIRTITEYPTSGDARRTRPEGKVQVRFTLTRAGQMHDAAIEQTSGSSILDKKALSIVKDGAYPAMPKDIWPNEAEHVFTVTVEFVAP